MLWGDEFWLLSNTGALMVVINNEQEKFKNIFSANQMHGFQ